MFFPTAGIEVSPFIPPLAALVISFFTSMGGVSGAFLLLPFQMSFLGYVNPSVSATNQFFNVVATPGGVWRFIREGRMVWPLTFAVAAGTLPGVFLGAWLRVAYLPDPKHFKLFAAAMMLYIGARMVRDLVRNAQTGKGAPLVRTSSRDGDARPGEAKGKPDARFSKVTIHEASGRRIVYEFQGKTYEASCSVLLILSFVVGVAGGVYGIGGGAIIAPFLVSIMGLPIHTVAGATLMGTFLTSVAGVAFYQAIAPLYPNMSVAPDWLLGLLFGLGGLAGMYLGARCQKFVPAAVIKWMLSAVIAYTALKYLLDYFK